MHTALHTSLFLSFSNWNFNECKDVCNISQNKILWKHFQQSSTSYFLPTVHSQWASRKVRTCPCASWAPISRALTKPTRSWVRRTRVGTGSLATYSSRGSCRNAATFNSPLRIVVHDTPSEVGSSAADRNQSAHNRFHVTSLLLATQVCSKQ